MPDSNAVSPTANLLKGKRGLVMGVANNRSIAWGIAKAAADAGAELAFTYQGDALKKRVEPLAKELGGHVVGHCDVTDGATIDAVFAEVEKLWGKLDFVVHCIAFSDKDELTGRYVETTEANFSKSLLISCYSFTAITQRAEKLMEGIEGERKADRVARIKFPAPAPCGKTPLTASELSKSFGSLEVFTDVGLAIDKGSRVVILGLNGAGKTTLLRILAPRRSGSTRSRPARSRRWRLPASAISATSCAGTSTTRRCAARSRSRRSARPRFSSSPTCRAASPARSCTSTPATTSSA